jgi:hypothetical protein
VGEDGVPQVTQINQRVPDAIDPTIIRIKNDITVGRYDVVMDTGPGYETKRLEGVDAMLDLLKTPLVEPISKVGADLIVRNMDFAGADDLADRLAPLTPQGLQSTIKQLPKEAQGIVTAMQQQLTQAQQVIQHLQLELKYKGGIEQGWMQVEREKNQMDTQVKANDAALKAHTSATDTHVKAQASIAVAEINQSGKLLDSHVKGKYDREAAEKAEKAAKAERKSD